MSSGGSDDRAPAPTDEERLFACRRILLSSPPGQFELILSDLRAVHSHVRRADLLSDDWADHVRKEYEAKTGRNVLSGDDGDGDSDDKGGDDEVGDGSELQSALRKRMESYMSRHFPSYGGGQVGKDFSNAAGFTVNADGKDGGSTVIATYAERVDLRNYHAGSWSARYSVRISPDGGGGKEATVEGAADLRAHAFEGGNVQLRSTVSLGPSTVVAAAGSTTDLADTVVNQIQQWETNDVQGRLVEMYDSVNDGMLKSLRRVMPVTRMRMDWNVQGHRVARTFAEKVRDGGAGASASGGRE